MAFLAKKKKRPAPARSTAFWQVALLCLTMGTFSALYLGAKTHLAALLPDPAARVEISVRGRVTDAAGQPLAFQAVRVEVNMPLWTDAGGFELTDNGDDSYFAGVVYPRTGRTGCLTGRLLVEGYPPHTFEFGLEEVNWGASLNLHMVAAADSLTTQALIDPSRHSPPGTARPALLPRCVLPALR